MIRYWSPREARKPRLGPWLDFEKWQSAMNEDFPNYYVCKKYLGKKWMKEKNYIKL